MSRQRNSRPRFLGAEHGIIPARAGTYSVPLAYLDACPAQAWDPSRLSAIRRAHDQGVASSLPAIVVVFFADGSLRIDDGNHRLTVARERASERIRVRYMRGGKRPVGGVFVIPPQAGGQAQPSTWGQAA